MNIKRAFSTVACMGLSAEQIIKCAHNENISAIEIRLDTDGSFMGYSHDNISSAKKLLDASNIKITDIGAGVCVKEYDPELLDKYKQAIDIAYAVGAKGVRIFLGNWNKLRTVKVAHDYDGIVKFLQNSCDYAAAFGVEVWIETHNEFSCGAVLAELIKTVGKDNLKVIWDIIHPFELGETAEETLAALGNRIAHVHIKDGRPSCDRNVFDYTYTKLGEGMLPIEHIIRLLDSFGYDGYYSLEWENQWRSEIKETYKSLDDVLSDFNFLMDKIEGNILPEITSDKWTTFVPEFKKIVDFSKDTRHMTLDMKISSDTYATGKWICEADIIPGETYDFSVALDTDAPTNEVYVIYTVMGPKGGYILRDHAKYADRQKNKIIFHDKFETPMADSDKLTVRLELWIKGYYSYAKYHQPTLSLGKPYPDRNVTVAIAYMRVSGECSLKINEQELLGCIDECAKHKPDIIVTGECMNSRGAGVPLEAHAETTNGYMCGKIKERAKLHSCYIVYNFHEKDGTEYYNTSILIGRDGNIVGKYRKTHLTVCEYEMGLTPGDSYPVFDTDFGKVGMLVCYDHYFSEPMEKIVANGAELVCISTAGDAGAQCITRAMDGAVYLAVCGWNTENEFGWEPGRIVDPTGKIIASTAKNRVPAVAQINLSEKVSRGYLSTGAQKSEYYSVYKYNRHAMEF